MALYRGLAIGVVGVHLAWILWVIFGWMLTARRRWLAWLHIGSLAYSIFIEIAPVWCPLTLAEIYFERRAGMTSYHQAFIVHYLDALIYPNLPAVLVTVVAVAVCAAILTLHVVRFRRATS